MSDEGRKRTLAEAADACLRAASAARKVEITIAAAAAWRHGELEPPTCARADEVPAPALPARLALVSPLRVPRRKMSTAVGLRAFLHAVAHIEFNAINLAWDCVARFGGMPTAYYDDWVTVAAEEAHHFSMLAARMRRLGCRYGDFPAHNGLWEMAAKTAGDLKARMAMVPRVLEARGLDVTPGMIERLEATGESEGAAVLAIIARDEVGHVAVGSRWFRHACARDGLDPDAEFRRLLDEYLAGRVRGPLALDARARAGFSRAELTHLRALVERDRGARCSQDRRS